MSLTPAESRREKMNQLGGSAQLVSGDTKENFARSKYGNLLS